ncbi:MAG: hypothetical protein HYV26_23565 [Candidatus Hydrogenedentes bacterium]|nr:hypothetical protein [Candidatus Hydrogenedentota bacterium]MBI3117537.1 hypothetical protein [Candidatus Hydrogenedentota bacterium]
MKEAGVEITRLCESWWSRLADSSRAEQQRYAENFLRLLGWEQPIPFSPREGAASLGALPFLLRGGGQTTVTVFFVSPGTLDPPATLLDRGIDFCPATRALVDDVAQAKLSFVLITDFYRSFLYDARTDDLLLHANDPRTFQEEFVPVLKRLQVERGALEELRRQPRSVVARQLREWSEHWIKEIALRCRVGEDTASLAIDRLLVIRYLFDRDILRRTKWRLQQRFTFVLQHAASDMPEHSGRELVHLFHDMWFDWHMDVFEGTPELDRAMVDDAIAVPLLREFALMGRSKFSIATILESFNHGEPAEKMRVRMVPDSNEERDHYLSRQTIESIDAARIELDLIEEGYRAIFHWFDKVTGLYERLEAAFAHRTRRQPQQEDFDLFAWSEQDKHRPNACSDKVTYACEHGFGAYYNSPRQYRIARLLLTLHLIDLYTQTRQAVNTFPSFKTILMKRPMVLSPERVMNVRRTVEPVSDYGAE